jgi:hypothetical protein
MPTLEGYRFGRIVIDGEEQIHLHESRGPRFSAQGRM